MKQTHKTALDNTASRQPVAYQGQSYTVTITRVADGDGHYQPLTNTERLAGFAASARQDRGVTRRAGFVRSHRTAATARVPSPAAGETDNFLHFNGGNHETHSQTISSAHSPRNRGPALGLALLLFRLAPDRGRSLPVAEGALTRANWAWICACRIQALFLPRLLVVRAAGPGPAG